MATRDLIAEFKALRLHGMAATWAELSDQAGAEIAAARWAIEQMVRAETSYPATPSVGHQMSAAKFPAHRDPWCLVILPVYCITAPAIWKQDVRF